MLFLLILCFCAALLATALLVRYARGHTERYGTAVPQRFHAGHVPRIGGIGMLAGCTAGWGWMRKRAKPGSMVLIPSSER